jgi:DNA-binding protein HU-beta
MNKAELIDAIAGQVSDVSKKAIGEIVDAFTASVTKALKKDDTVSLVGFGTFKTTKRAARTGRNPQTGAALKIAAAVVPKFTPGKTLKDAVNKGGKK